MHITAMMISLGYRLKKEMANYNRPPPIKSLPLMPSPMPFLRSRSVLSSPNHCYSPWTIHHGPQVMPVYALRVSSIDDQMVQPALHYQSPLPSRPRLTSCWSIPRHPPPTHCPPPCVSSSNSHHYQLANYEIVKPISNFESVFTSWLSHYEPIFKERRRQFKEQNTIHLPHYRNMLLKWLELIRKIQSVGEGDSTDCEMPSSLLLQNELNAVQQYCTNPHIINLVKKKLHSIHKKRRYIQRMRDRRQTLLVESSSPATCSVVILPSTTGSILDRIKSDILLTTQQSDDHNQTRIDPDSKTKNDDDIKYELPIDHFVSDDDCKISSSKISAHNKKISRNQNLYKESLSNSSFTSNIITSQETNHTHYYYQMKTTLRKSIDECQTRLKLLDSLKPLRLARLTQAEQQGGLFPYQLDEKFNSDVNEMKDQLSDQIQKLELSYSKVKDVIRNISNHQSKNNYNNITQSEGTCCIHVPNLPKLLKMELFGNYSNTNSSNILRRWQRFYHQADYNFCDFIRIRYAWDKYLEVDAPTNENGLENLTSLELPKNWISPKINDNHENSNNDNHNGDVVTDNQHGEEIVSVDEKWRKYLKPIPTVAHPSPVL
ncbi:hypothetical protein MN116_007906 [Schistosoma mekongi]|uniref:Oligodendrocyte transcription factor 2 n=1 Tax=Schistosoma mekongi TaxID=38744 RepID=A0AAE2D2H8_SCHME|nr:hypothetical protein MN116_007906 [Schistosoma mekongi]